MSPAEKLAEDQDQEPSSSREVGRHLNILACLLEPLI